MKMRIEVVYALAQAQTIIALELEPGARVADALAASGLLALAQGRRVGIWGAPALPDTELRDRDRVEIYRELAADPKQVRRQRARQQRGTGTGR